MNLLADKILDFYANVNYEGKLPDSIGIMNPYRESEDIRMLCGLFYRKYYSDLNHRKLILGINPGRLGGGATGIPFTDTKRLNEECSIPYPNFVTHEPSSVFIYEMIRAFGGPEAFYARFYINSVCPLGFIKVDGHKAVNYNYYDSKELEAAMKAFIIENIKKQIDLSGSDKVCYCLGMGKNFQYLKKLNNEFGFFSNIIPLEHPRYIMQYKAKLKEHYIADYLYKLSI